jgi:glycosyltransferase involved in cell wall biosynthesis
MTTLGLVMIVRDEAERIGACLAAARPYISSWTVVDTGSVDETPEIVERMLGGERDPLDYWGMDRSHTWTDRGDVATCPCGERKTGGGPYWGCPTGACGEWCTFAPGPIPGTLHRSPWVDFGTNRSEALALARGTADWLLALDADMVVTIDPGWQPDPDVDAYMVAMGNGGAFTWRLPLVLNGRVIFRSIGRCHEYTARADGAPMRTEPTDAVRVRYPDRSSTGKSRWHLELLQRDLDERPDDPRTVFYMAQTLRDLGRASEAQAFYERRAAMGGFEEERWYAQYRAASLEADPVRRLGALLLAWDARPERHEARYALVAELAATDHHHAAYALSDGPWNPPADGLFVDRDADLWGLAFWRSVAAWWIGWTEEALALCDDLLANPNLPAHFRAAVERNRAYCTEGAA